MKSYLIITLGFILSFYGQLLAQQTDTIYVHSLSMKKDIPNIIILPASYIEQPDRHYPVIYLLHGYGGNFSTWAKQTKPDLDQLASSLEFVIVCPDGGNSWYWDDSKNPTSCYETYVSKELITYIDKNYRTIQSRTGRAITGFSMGGHGGLWLGFRHPDLFSACGSMSGGVDLLPFPNNWNLKAILGNQTENSAYWNKHTVINLISSDCPSDSLNIVIDCGTEDFFFQVNQNLHQKLLQHHIPHDYIVRPGKHNHTYWNNAIDYQLLFFKKALKSQ